MYGRVLKISNNDLYGNQDNRNIVVFAAFNHTKYMNKYVIFAFEGEYDKNKLCYGSIHFKNNSVVIFEVSKNVIPYIEDFIERFQSNNLAGSEFELLDISGYSKVELVSYNEKDYDKLAELDSLHVRRVDDPTNGEEPEKNHFILYLIIMLLVVTIAGEIFLYLFPDTFKVYLKKLECNGNLRNSELAMRYDSVRNITFDKDERVKEISVIDTYKFDSDKYNEFKDNNSVDEYFKDITIDNYEFNDIDHTLTLHYRNDLIIVTFDEMKDFLDDLGYTCVEGTYEE